MHTLSLAFHTPDPGPAKSDRQILQKPSLLLIHACGLLLQTHTHTYSVCCAWSYSPFLTISAHTQSPGASMPPSMCHCFWHTGLNKSLEHGSNHPYTQSYLSALSQPAYCTAAGRLSLLVGYEQLARKTFEFCQLICSQLSAYACNSLWHFISSLVTVFIVYYHNINNNDEVIIKLEAI